MNYRMTDVDQRVRRLLERVEQLDPDLATELWDAVWAQVMQAISRSGTAPAASVPCTVDLMPTAPGP